MLHSARMMNRQMWRYLGGAIVLTLAGCFLFFCDTPITKFHFKAFVLAYFGLGIAFFVLLSMLYRGIGLKGRWVGFAIFTIDSIWLILFWPVAAAGALLCWSAELLHLTSKQKDAKRREEEAKRSNRFSRMSLDELLSEQRKALGATERRE
jgi:hypothetical protein